MNFFPTFREVFAIVYSRKSFGGKTVNMETAEPMNTSITQTLGTYLISIISAIAETNFRHFCRYLSDCEYKREISQAADDS